MTATAALVASMATPAAGAAPSTQAAPSIAPEAVESIVLTYETNGACPSQSTFIEWVHAYTTTRWTLVSEGATAGRTIRVRVAAQPAGVTGSLTVTRKTGTTSERQLAGPSCEAVAQALAIMVAVAIDPHADGNGPEPPVLDELQPEPPSLAPSIGNGSGPLATPSPPSDSAPHPAIEPPNTPRVRIATDVRAEVTSAIVDAALPVFGLSVSFLFPPLASRPLPSWLRPSIAVGVRQSLPIDLARQSGATEFLWTVGNLRLCPIRFVTRGELLELSLCAETNLGALRARAREYDEARKSSIPWIDIGGSAWASLNVTRDIFVSATVEGIAPYSRRRFELASGALVSRAPAFGLLGGLGVGLRL